MDNDLFARIIKGSDEVNVNGPVAVLTIRGFLSTAEGAFDSLGMGKNVRRR